MPNTEPDYVIENYFNYLQQWKYDRAYDFLSAKQRKKTAKFKYFPNSPFGGWWETCAFPMNYFIQSGKNTSKVYLCLFGITTWNKLYQIGELKIENGLWQVDTIRDFNPVKDRELMLKKNGGPFLEREADSLFNNHHYLEAFQYYLILTIHDPLNIDLKSKLAYVSAILSYETKEVWERGSFKYMPFAQSEYDVVLQFAADHPIANMAKGVNLLLTPSYYGDIDGAIECFKKVKIKDPDNYYASFYLVQAYKKKNMKKEYRIEKSFLKRNKQKEYFVNPS